MNLLMPGHYIFRGGTVTKTTSILFKMCLPLKHKYSNELVGTKSNFLSSLQVNVL